jgi:purine-binding chemotaxis protein CheW
MDQSIKDNENTQQSMFALRGDLDGGIETQDFSEISQFIGFIISQEEFLLPIEVMNEIIMIPRITFVPGAPKYVEGVINLRGTILPTINLRKMMGLTQYSSSNHGRIIICHQEEHTIGLLVDGITYVVSLHPDQIQTQTLVSKGTGAELISGISKRDEKVNGIIDIAKVITETLQSASREPKYESASGS